jgi:hypothetical protein
MGLLFAPYDFGYSVRDIAYTILLALKCADDKADPADQVILIDGDCILALWVLLIRENLYNVDKGFHDFAVGGFGRWSIGLRAPP